MATHDRLSFTLKSRAESLAFMSAVYARALPEAICEQLPLTVGP